jgi:hypothetical protein
MTTYYKYRIYCSTDNKNEFWYLSENDSLPTTCPINTSHTIIPSSVVIVDKFEKNLVEISEEKGITGGSFGVYSKKIICEANTTEDTHQSWPYPISALCIDFITNNTHIYDEITLKVGEDTIIGKITSSVIPASSWTLRNYVAGEIVTYTHPRFNNRVYTCIKNTSNTENPENTQYWRHGFELSVSSNLLQYTSTGYYINLYDGTNINNMERVISIDKINNKIYVEGNLINPFNYLTTYVRQTIYLLKNFVIGEPGTYTFGKSKIRGSYVPADTTVTISYINKSTSDPKTVVGRLEYLY